MILLTWNRDTEGGWPRNEFERNRRTLQRRPLTGQWSVGRRVNIAAQSPFFMFAQGQQQPRGLIGRGAVMSPPFEGDHWSGASRSTQYVRIRWTELLPYDDPINVLLLEQDVPDIRWRGIQSSGWQVRPESERALVDAWEKYAGLLPEPPPGEIVDGDTYPEGAVVRVEVNRYERDPRARAAALAHWGPVCQACSTDLREVYGLELGARGVHVHHVVPVSQLGPNYQVNPRTDLVPLCPNCHVMIHKTDPLMTPKQFARTILRRRGS